VTEASATDVTERARRVRLIGFDVDGVCTDGKLYYGPAGEMLHAFHARDGLGMVTARMAGMLLCAISGRDSAHVGARMKELRVPHVLQGVGNKLAAMEQLLGTLGIAFEEIAYIGDDVNDLPLLLQAGLSAAPADAVSDVRASVHMVCERGGGQGALRELIERVLKAQERWTWAA
jgi:3-deoxy-D-manno-octulosonate 8-phosphate phosphatase (KDO 8-P phosphatase)